jgi:hypothetical protein
MTLQNQRICEQETMREGRRILRKLAEEGGYLAPAQEGDFALVSCMLPGSVRVAAALVREFRRRDWLAPRAEQRETFAVSDAGVGWLRRQQADHEPFAAQHQLRSERLVKGEDGVEHLVVVNDGESPLGWLRRRGIIDAAELEAGERLRRDFTLAQLTPRMGIDLGAPVVDGSRGTAHDVAVADTVLDAKQRFSRAMRAAGPVLSDLLFDVCCHLIGLEAAESARDWPRRTAKVVLQIGLGRLAGHYGLNVRRHRAAMRSWHLECGEELQPSP